MIIKIKIKCILDLICIYFFLNIPKKKSQIAMRDFGFRILFLRIHRYYSIQFVTGMMTSSLRESHVDEDKILRVLVVDNSNAEDELQLGEKDQHGIENVKKKVELDGLVQALRADILGELAPDELVPIFKWRRNSYIPHDFHERDYKFGNVNLFSDRNGMLTPMDVFMEATQLDRLITDIIVPESIRYAKHNSRLFTTDPAEIKAFLGMNFVMSSHVLPNIGSYWHSDDGEGVPFVYNIMSRSRFEQIIQNLHFVDNEDQSQATDKAYKIRPVVQHFNCSFQKAMNNSKKQTIGERVIKFKGSSGNKKLNIDNKPKERGFKMLCRTDSTTGYLFECDFYGRKMNNESCLGEHVVLNMTKQLNGLGCEIFLDTYFNNPALQYRLMQQDIKACGIVRVDGKYIPKTLPMDRTMQRGDIYAESFQGISFVKWMDAKAVHMLTNFISPVQRRFVKRKEPKSEELVNVSCPEVVAMFNEHAGGVKLMEQRKTCYEIDRLAKIKYYLCLFFDLLDIGMNNAYLLYVKLHEAQRMEGPLLSSVEYRQHVAQELTKEIPRRQPISPVLGTSSLLTHKMRKAKKSKKCINCAEILLERRTYYECTTCNVHLCFTKNRNCFEDYHEYKEFLRAKTL